MRRVGACEHDGGLIARCEQPRPDAFASGLPGGELKVCKGVQMPIPKPREDVSSRVVNQRRSHTTSPGVLVGTTQCSQILANAGPRRQRLLANADRVTATRGHRCTGM
jgi:hypothetical protein